MVNVEAHLNIDLLSDNFLQLQAMALPKEVSFAVRAVVQN